MFFIAIFDQFGSYFMQLLHLDLKIDASTAPSKASSAQTYLKIDIFNPQLLLF